MVIFRFSYFLLSLPAALTYHVTPDLESTLEVETCRPDGVSLLQTNMQRVHKHRFSRLGLASHEASGTDDADKTSCNVGTDEGCKTMCRWLKLTDQDAADEPDLNTANNAAEGPTGKCHLFEWTLNSCGYEPAGNREENDPIDCAVDYLRASVMETEVKDYVKRIDDCLNSLPQSAMKKYQVAINLLMKETHDYKEEMQLTANATVLSSRLKEVSAQAKAALTAHSSEEAVIKDLEVVLADAEQLPGHYMVDDVHTAREYLEELSPIPPVREELTKALEEGKAAMNVDALESHPTRDLGQLWPLIVRLNVSVVEATELGMGDPLPEARKTLKQLTELRAKFQAFRTAMFVGNVSLGTKLGMPAAIALLKDTLPWAEEEGLIRGPPRAHWLLSSLEKALVVLQSLKEATASGQAVLNQTATVSSKKLVASVKHLNGSLTLARNINVGGHEVDSAAQDTLDALEYVEEARKALRKSLALAALVVEANRSDMSDDAEEKAVDELKPAMAWGSELGLPLASAEAAKAKLEAIEDTKVNMTQALALGNASWSAKVGEKNAIAVLSGAVAQNERENVTAGVAEAKRLMTMLEARLTAKAELKDAEDVGKSALETGDALLDAAHSLNRTMIAASKQDLDEQVAIAQSMLDALMAAWKQQQELDKVKNNKQSWDGEEEGDLDVPEIEDHHARASFHRSGYKPVDLPDPENSMDDGDDDFDEHLKVLSSAINRAHRHGEINPEWEVLFQEIQKMSRTYNLLQHAITDGEAAMKTKKIIDSAIEELTTAIGQAKAVGVNLRLAEATELLELLLQIQPARDEFEAAMLQANISYHTERLMGNALIRLDAAVKVCKQLDIQDHMKEADDMTRKLTELKKTHTDLKAAIVQGEFALNHEEGEEAALGNLNKALKVAKAVDLQRDVPVALDLDMELDHMNDEQAHLADAVSPYD